MIPIDRAGTTRTLKAMVGEAKQRADNYRQIVIFPEGTRKAPGAPPEYHAAGISALAKAIEAPIVPVATNAGLCWPGRGLLRRPGKVVYEILSPIPGGLPRRDMMARLQSELEPATDKLVKEGLWCTGPANCRPVRGIPDMVSSSTPKKKKTLRPHPAVRLAAACRRCLVGLVACRQRPDQSGCG
jgi:hypothetical protein